MNNQSWNARQYQENASFVAELGSPVLELLNPRPDEVILDLGCGDGALTEKIDKLAYEVVGIDSSESMVQATQLRGLNAVLMSGDAISYEGKFDAVFTNAALHWITDYQAVFRGVSSALKANGRFVGEFGGYGNIATLIAAMEAVVGRNPIKGEFNNPWYFPTTEEYGMHLEQNGFVVKYIELIPRPTPLKTGVREWLKVFANHIISEMPKDMEATFLSETELLVRPMLFSETAGWHADYVRLRFHAIKA